MRIKQCGHCGNIYANGNTFCPVCERKSCFVFDVECEVVE